MKVPTFDEKPQIFDNLHEIKLILTEDPFTGQLMVFNEETQRDEVYREHEWINGKKVKFEPYVVRDMPPINRRNLSKASA